jgi:tetratricopeptide (TPR) repeat protein
VRRLPLLAGAALAALTAGAAAAHAQGAADSLVAVGRAAAARGDHAEAWRAFRAAYDPAADDARVLALLAGAAAAQGDVAPTHALLDSVVRAGDGGPHAIEVWAALSLDRNASPDSVAAVAEARARAREADAFALVGVARVLAAHGYDLVGIGLLERAALRGAASARTLLARGELLEGAGDAAGALEAWLGAAAEPEAVARMRALLAARPPGYARDPLLEHLRRARDRGVEPAASVAAELLAEIDAPAAAPAAAAEGRDDPVAAARDTTELAAALAPLPAGAGPGGAAARRPVDPRLAALRAGDLWLARGARDSAVAAYARAVDAAPPVGAAAFEALARIRLVRALGGAPARPVAELGVLAVAATADPGGAAAALEALVPALGLADSAAARSLLAALAGEWRGRSGDAAGASAELEAAAATAGVEAPALLLAAGRWARDARENERARALWRAVVERHGDTPYALEARRLLAEPEPRG